MNEHICPENDFRAFLEENGGDDMKDEIGVELKDDDKTLDRYSMDMSRYKVRPKMVAFPKDESEVISLIEKCKKERIPITARAAGSNLSGNAVGSGVIVMFTEMKELLEIDDGHVFFQPGLVYDKLNDMMEDRGFFLPYHVSSSKFCSLGGNVATRASGLRSIKYGTVDTSVRSLRFINPVYGIVDTREGLPRDLEEKILDLRDRVMKDKEALKVLKRKKGLKTSMGYNLRALLDHDDPGEIVAHLLVGSVGTLGLFTGVGMELRPIPEKKAMLVALFDGLGSAGEAVPELAKLDPSLLELMDSYGTEIIRSSTDLDVPLEARATLLIEFDENVDEGKESVRNILSKHALTYDLLEDDPEQDLIWGLRWKMLLRIKRDNETPDRKYLSFVDDLGVPVEKLPSFIKEIEKVFRDEGVPVVIYGHIGEGNLHVRPLIEKENWKEDMRRLGEKCFRIAFGYGGTLAAEHGAGRNRSEFIREEWGDSVYSYFREIKDIFDPDDILNPGIMFSDRDFTEDLQF